MGVKSPCSTCARKADVHLRTVNMDYCEPCLVIVKKRLAGASGTKSNVLKKCMECSRYGNLSKRFCECGSNRFNIVS